MTKPLYFLLENINLPDGEAQAFFSLGEQEGASNDSPYPNLRNHAPGHQRNDGQAQLYQGDFPELNQGRIVSLLARVHDGNTQAAPNPSHEYGWELVINSQPPGSVQLCRAIIFGGLNATLEESHAQVTAYLAANRAAWEEPF